MNVYLNNEQVEILEAKCISEILTDHLKLDNPKGIAVAVNQEVIPKIQWDDFFIKENDTLTVIKATQGG